MRQITVINETGFGGVWTTPTHPRERCSCRQYSGRETVLFPVSRTMLKKGETKAPTLPILKGILGVFWNYGDGCLTNTLLDQIS